jgi:hypothetical protein
VLKDVLRDAKAVDPRAVAAGQVLEEIAVAVGAEHRVMAAHTGRVLAREAKAIVLRPPDGDLALEAEDAIRVPPEEQLKIAVIHIAQPRRSAQRQLSAARAVSLETVRRIHVR